MLNHQGLQEFVAVVEQGGFTAASKELGVSISFVSRQVKRLEDRLEIRLLHRTVLSSCRIVVKRLRDFLSIPG